MDIKIEDYLNHSEIKEIVQDELRSQIKTYFKNEENANRLISNIAYQIVFDEVDKIIPNSIELIKEKTIKVLEGNHFQYSIFRDKGFGYGNSLASQIIEDTVKDSKSLIEEKIKETITSKDISHEVWDKFEELGESFISNIYEIVRLGKENTNKHLAI